MSVYTNGGMKYKIGRAYFNLHNRPAFLHIDPIRLTDAGDYRCRVDFKKARTVNTVISLKVIGKSISSCFPNFLLTISFYHAKRLYFYCSLQSTMIITTVTVPPDDPVITDVDGNDMKGLVGPFNEGDELKLLCISNGGKKIIRPFSLYVSSLQEGFPTIFPSIT